MSGINGTARRLRRSGRLRIEATNCLAIAVREAEADTAALLIDEAVRLATRARELGERDDAERAPAQMPRDHRPRGSTSQHGDCQGHCGA